MLRSLSKEGRRWLVGRFGKCNYKSTYEYNRLTKEQKEIMNDLIDAFCYTTLFNKRPEEKLWTM